MNEGGRLLYTGKFAGREYTLAEYPVPGATPEECDGVPGDQDWDEPCKDLSNDFLQYWLGSYSRADTGGIADDGSLLRFAGVGDPLAGFTGELDGADSAQNQAAAAGSAPATHLITSSVLEPATHPDFASSPGGVVGGRRPVHRPHRHVVHALAGRRPGLEAPDADDRPDRQAARRARVLGELEHRGGLGLMVVEAHTVGQDNWTTLPDLNGHTSSDTGTNQSCPAGDDYFDLHPFVAHYITRTGTGSAADPYVCTPGGTRARGTRRTGPRPATSRGRSTSASSPDSRSRSRSR